MKQTTSERLKYILSERNLRQADVLEMIKPYCEKYGVTIQRNALSQYITGKVVPKQDKIYILSKALGVSEAWLMGFDVPMARRTSAEKNQADHNDQPDREEFIRLFEALNQENRQRILDLMRVLSSGQKHTGAPLE